MNRLSLLALALLLTACAPVDAYGFTPAAPAPVQDIYAAGEYAGLTQTAVSIQSTGTQLARDYASTQQAGEVGMVVTRISAEATGTAAALDAVSTQARYTEQAVGVMVAQGEATQAVDNRATAGAQTQTPVAATVEALVLQVQTDREAAANEPFIQLVKAGGFFIMLITIGMGIAFAVYDWMGRMAAVEEQKEINRHDEIMWGKAERLALLGIVMDDYPLSLPGGKTYPHGPGTDRMTDVLSISRMGTPVPEGTLELVQDAIEVAGKDSKTIPSQAELGWASSSGWQEAVRYLKDLGYVIAVNRIETRITQRGGGTLGGLWAKLVMITPPTPLDGVMRDAE